VALRPDSMQRDLTFSWKRWIHSVGLPGAMYSGWGWLKGS
jgi:hypothetical protein